LFNPSISDGPDLDRFGPDRAPFLGFKKIFVGALNPPIMLNPTQNIQNWHWLHVQK